MSIFNFVEKWSTTKEDYVDRLRICRKCSYRKFNVCIKCGCPIHTKAVVKASTCPTNQWKEHKMKEVIVSGPESGFIGAWYLDDIDVCDGLIEYYDESPNKWRGQIGAKYSTDESGVQLEKKDSWDVSLGQDSRDNRWIRYAEELQKVTEQYIKKYPWCNNGAPWTMYERCNIQYYPPGGGFKIWHTERNSARFPNAMRHLVFMTYLNDVNDPDDEYAGGTEFLHQDVKIKAKKGLTVIWPADWTHVHRGIISEKSSKYIITGWYSFND